MAHRAARRAGNEPRFGLPRPAPAPATIGDPPPPKAPPAWPEGRLEGEPAKRLLLDLLVEAGERLRRIDDYTAILRKQERIGGELGDEQSLLMKVRHRPFAIYFKFLPPARARRSSTPKGATTTR